MVCQRSINHSTSTGDKNIIVHIIWTIKLYHEHDIYDQSYNHDPYKIIDIYINDMLTLFQI